MDIIFVIIVSLLLSGFFSGSETALFGLTESKIEVLRKSNPSLSKLISKIKSNPEVLISTILIGNNIVNIGSSSLVSILVSVKYGNEAVGIFAGIMTFLVLLFGEIIPKTLATSNPTGFAKYVAFPLSILIIILRPIIFITSLITKVIVKLMRVKKEIKVSHEEEIKVLAHLGEANGGIEEYERDYLEKVFLLNDKKVLDAMVKKESVFAIPAHKSIESSIELILKNHYNRIPLYESGSGIYTGYLYLRDVLSIEPKYWNSISVDSIKRIAIRTTPDTKLKTVFFELLKSKTHLAVVTKDGADVGIITVEDILEELVGDINDESDPL